MSAITVSFPVLDDRLCRQREALLNMLGVIHSVSVALAALDWRASETPNRVCGLMNVLTVVERRLREMHATIAKGVA